MQYTSKIYNNDIVVFTINGLLNSRYQLTPIIDELENWISDGNRQFIIDCAAIELINSGGLSILLTMLTKARNAGGDLYLANISSQVSKLLIITKLYAIFAVFDTVEEAIEEIKQTTYSK